MVLISHEKELIFIKTVKSASTSVEESLEFHLLGVPQGGFGEQTKERVTVDSYVSGRGTFSATRDYIPSHISSKRLLGMLGQERFSSYLKVATVRNPWDQIVSFFWWRLRDRQRLKSLAVKAPMWFVRLWFAIWFFANRSRVRGISFTESLAVKGRIPSMHIIRFENLESDLKDLLTKLGNPNHIDYLPTRKTQHRLRPEIFQHYYFPFVRNIVAKDRARDLANFGYEWHMGEGRS